MLVILQWKDDHGILSVENLQQAKSYTHQQIGNVHAWDIIFCFVVRGSGHWVKDKPLAFLRYTLDTPARFTATLVFAPRRYTFPVPDESTMAFPIVPFTSTLPVLHGRTVIYIRQVVSFKLSTDQAALSGHCNNQFCSNDAL